MQQEKRLDRNEVYAVHHHHHHYHHYLHHHHHHHHHQLCRYYFKIQPSLESVPSRSMATSAQRDGKVTPPLETKANMDKDYDYYIAKYNGQAPAPAPSNPQQSSRSTSTGNHHNSNKYHGNLGAMPMEPVMEQVAMGTPPRPPNNRAADPAGSSPAEEKIDGDEALLDLAQLEELHHEAERMKALGNKHMAAQVCRSTL